MKRLASLLTLLIALAVYNPVCAQVYSNVLVEVNLCAEMTALNVSAPFVWCREDNKLYYFDAGTLAFTPYPAAGLVTSVNGQSGVVTLTKADIGLNNVDNTSDATKNTASATLTNKTLTSPVINTPTGIIKGDVGLGNVDNTSDTTKNAASVTLTNKTISGASNTISAIAQSSVTNLTTDLAAKVALTQPYGYTVNFQALTSSPVDAQTIYLGQLPKAPVTVTATSKIFIRKAGTIKSAQLYTLSGTAGTGEAWSCNIRLNNTTDTLIQTISLATAERIFTNSSLNIAVVAGDYFEIKCVNPTWATNPLTTVFGGYIYIE